jgi:hypothetical protein
VINYRPRSTSTWSRWEPRNDGFESGRPAGGEDLQYGIHRFGVYIDVVNLFNAGTVTSRQTRYPNRGFLGFNVLSAIRRPSRARQGTVGLRWSLAKGQVGR